MANLQQLRSTVLVPKRGVIYDRNMVPLAQSASVWDVVLEPNYLKKDEKKREIICSGLSEILDVPIDKMRELAQKNSYYVNVKKKIDNNAKNAIIDLKSKNKISNGIRLIENYKRFYPGENLASTILGFVGNDGRGLSGIEYCYDDDLKGGVGKLVTPKNAQGTDMPYNCEHRIDPEDGKNIISTIDSTIQKIVEDRLEQVVKNEKVKKRATCVVMNPKNGEILALAVKEDYDPNHPFELCREEDIETLEHTPEDQKEKVKNQLLAQQWRNKAVSDNYYPGSVFKMIVASMALELGLMKDDIKFNCTGAIKIADRTIRCHKRSGHGVVDFTGAFCGSCNPAFISMGQMIGSQNFFRFYESFGFHEKTGIDLPGETRDVFFKEQSNIPPIHLAMASIGQNFGITPIQMITAACAIANGGDLITPHIVKEIRDNDGNIVKSFPGKIRRNVISKQTAKIVSKMLEQNAISGGAKNAYIPGFRVAGKTGTSEKKEGILVPGEKDYISSFCGFAPADDPQLIMLTYFDTPKSGNYYGAQVAAPMFRSAMCEILPYIGVTPRYSDEELKKYGVRVSNMVGEKVNAAKNEAISLGLKPTIIGKGENIVSQNPSPGSYTTKNASIVLYTDEPGIKVPNLIGMTKSDAKSALESLGLKASFSGDTDGVVVSQTPIKDNSLKKGSTVNVVIKNKR